MDKFLDSPNDELYFEILDSIVQNIIEDAFFCLEDDEEDHFEAITMKNPLKLFSK